MGSVRSPAVEDVTRIRPFSGNTRAAARTVAKVPLRLVSTTWSHFSSVYRAIAPSSVR